MKISIIIATYNASNTLKCCLDSIVPQLTDETELIIIDGQSTDDTNGIITSYGARVAMHLSEPDRGIYDAWNKGVKVAKGEWLMFMGADDVLIPGALNAYMGVIKATSDVGSYDYICAYNEYVDMKGKLLKILGCEPEWWKMRRGMVAAHVASLHNRRNLFETIGGYNLDFKICADYDLLLRKKQGLKYLFVPTRIARMKVGGMSFSTKAIVETYRIRRLNNSLPLGINELFFLRDWFAYKCFKLRKALRGGLGSAIITWVKGENYVIDSAVPTCRIIRLFWAKGLSMCYGMMRLRTFRKVFIHPSSKILCSSRISFGRNFNIDCQCYVDALSEKGLICGDNVSIGFHTHIELTGSMKQIGLGMKVGNNVGFGSHGYYGSGAGFVEIGDNTILGNYVSIHPENHNYEDRHIPIRMQGVNSKGGVKIGRNCWIGAKATILDGTVIGDNCIVAAGAVVKGVFPDNVMLGGVPAKIIKQIYE